MNATTRPRPTPEAIRDAVYAAITRSGRGGISASWLLDVRPAGLGKDRNVRAAERDVALAGLIAEGKVVREIEARKSGTAPVIYRLPRRAGRAS